MHRTGKPRSDRIATWALVFIIHALLGWMLLRAPMPPLAATNVDSTMNLIWVEARRPPSATPPRVRSAIVASPRSISGHAPTPSSRAASLQPALEVAPAPAAPLSAVFIQQAVEATLRAAPGTVQTDPFATHAVRLPGRAASTFRMRPPPSLAERVAQVGKLFGGVDDPCRSARDSINQLSQAGDSRVLQDALDYERRFCR